MNADCVLLTRDVFLKTSGAVLLQKLKEQCRPELHIIASDSALHHALPSMQNCIQELCASGCLRPVRCPLEEERTLFYQFVLENAPYCRILVISCDEVLTRRLFRLNRKNEEAGLRTAEIADFTSKGFLISHRKKPVFEMDGIRSELSNAPLPVGKLPHSGQRVRTENGRLLRLQEQISSGGEGIVYAVSSAHCVKIFNRNSNSALRQEKIRQLMRKSYALKERSPVLTARMSLPEQFVMNAQGEIVGYIMPLFRNTKSLSAYSRRNFPKLIPGVNRMHQFRMALSLAEMTAFCNENRLFLGDILSSPNILVGESQEIYFVDMESVQFTVNHILYPCCAGREDCMSPEHIETKQYSFLRTEADDSWALQLLLFKILTCSTPYTRKNAAVRFEEDVKNGRYPYYGDRQHPEEPNAVASSELREIIRELPEFLRQDFYDAFHGKGKYFKEADRRNAERWFRICLHCQDVMQERIRKNPEYGRFHYCHEI